MVSKVSHVSNAQNVEGSSHAAALAQTRRGSVSGTERPVASLLDGLPRANEPAEQCGVSAQKPLRNAPLKQIGRAHV